MGIPMAYNTGTTNTYTEKTVKRGTVALNPGPTLAPSYNWFNGVDVTSSQYLIYSDTYTMGQATQANSRPTAWTTPDLSDSSLLNLINTLPERVGQVPFNYLPVALKWLHQSNRYFLLKNNFENIVTNGLLTNLDASWPNSYSGTTTWFNLAENDNISLYNTPTFSSNDGGSISFDGNDDYATTGVNTLPVSLRGNPQFTIGGWFKRSGTWTGGATWGIGTPGGATNINSYNWDVDSSIGIDLYGNTTYNTNQTYSNTEWKHVMWTYNGNGFNNNNIIIYINGVEYTGDGLITKRYSGAAPNVGTNGLTLGRVSAAENSYYGKPIIGNFQVYNRVLSKSEITQNIYAQGYRFGYSADTVVTSGLTVYLDASNGVSNPGSGNTWYDMSVSKSNNISLINGASFSTFSGGTIYLDGTNDYGVSVKDSNILGSSPRTYIGWYYIIGASGAWGNLMTTGNNDCSSLMFGWARQNGTLMTWGGCYDASTGQELPLNTWLFIAASYDGVNYDAYVNTNTVRLNRPAYNTSESKIFLGAETTTNGSSFRGYMNGHIGSFYQYNRALSSAEITQMYNATKGRFGL